MNNKNDSKTITGICPARGGSKGLENKHLLELDEIPVLAHTIREARKSSALDEFVVTSEDPEIQDTARRYRADVIERPAELADDDTPMVDVVQHVLEQLELKRRLPDVFVLLQPTSPLRMASDIDGAVEVFRNQEPDAVVSVTTPDDSPYHCFRIKNGMLSPLLDEEQVEKRRQDQPETVRVNGAVYVTTPDVFRDQDSLLPEKTMPFRMPPERSVDIDNRLDFLLARAILQDREEEESSASADPE